MKHKVVITAQALLDVSEATTWWAENRSVDQATRWHEGIHRAMQDLSRNPEHHALAHENDAFPITLRQLLFGLGRKPTHRVIFHIKDEVVTILSVRHVAQSDLAPGDF